ncbi:hypothetical protein IFM89_028015 [Coptis chinensis]|uniref:DUF4283 domain-containing protein n=1 Tax=Coptis chinensis TaxID=261450 RepID=A0A835HPZ9_9MAGN|nr:hypothetical protein IFM89_028015 [Coptis chinensis]
MASTPLSVWGVAEIRCSLYGDSTTQGGVEHTFDLSKIPILSTKRDKPSIKIPLKAIEKYIEACKHALVGRLDMQVSTLEAIKAEVNAKWGLSGKVKLTPMGKGFVLFKMDNEA